jgi:hypothetical protein
VQGLRTGSSRGSGLALEPTSWATLVLLAIAVMVRVAISFPSHKFPPDADCVLPGLAALKVLHGHPAVFFGSLRLGAIGSYPLALLFLLFGASRSTLAAGPMLIDILLLGVWYLFLRELLGARIALLALPFAAVPSPAFTFWTYMPNGYPETLLFCAAILWLAARLARGDERHLTVFALGSALGLGWWTSPQTLGCGLPALLWMIWRRPGLARRWQAVPPLALGVLLGALPWIAFNVRYPLASLHDNFAVRPVHDLMGMVDNGRYLLAENVPEMLASIDPQRGVNPSNLAQRLLRLPTLVILVGAGCFVLLVAPLLRRRRTAPEKPLGGGTGPPDPRLAVIESIERNAWPLFVLVLVVNALLNLVSGAGSLRGLTVRYVLPIYLIVPAVLALLLARVALRSRTLAALLAGVVLAFNVAGTFWPWTPARQAWAAKAAGDERLLRLLSNQGVGAVLGPYWLVYPVNFLSQEAILGIPLEPGTDYRKETERLGRSPVRWALMTYRREDLARWAGEAGILGDEIALPGAYALVLPRDPAPPEPFRQRLVAAWRDCCLPRAACVPSGGTPSARVSFRSRPPRHREELVAQEGREQARAGAEHAGEQREERPRQSRQGEGQGDRRHPSALDLEAGALEGPVERGAGEERAVAAIEDAAVAVFEAAAEQGQPHRQVGDVGDRDEEQSPRRQGAVDHGERLLGVRQMLQRVGGEDRVVSRGQSCQGVQLDDDRAGEEARQGRQAVERPFEPHPDESRTAHEPRDVGREGPQLEQAAPLDHLPDPAREDAVGGPREILQDVAFRALEPSGWSGHGEAHFFPAESTFIRGAGDLALALERCYSRGVDGPSGGGSPSHTVFA